jgi:broad specificity phosphatase PhoE
MIITRHASLLPPYQDYQTLTLAELEFLGQQVIDPPIDTNFDLGCVSSILKNNSSSMSVWVTSESVRTEQTAKCVQKLIGVTCPIEIDPLLNEIKFSPQQIMAKYENYSSPLDAVCAYFTMETFICPKTHERYQQMLCKYQNEPVLLFSHGFFMQYILYQQFKKVGRVDYLESFEL